MPARADWGKASRRALAGAAVGLAAGLVVLLVHSTGALDAVENISVDWRQAHAGADAAPAKSGGPRFPGPVALVYLGQPSLAAGKKNGVHWPWPRELWKDVLAFLRRGGARAAAFDLFFSEGSSYRQADDDAFAKALREFKDAYLIAAFSGGESEPDAAALARAEELAPRVELEDPALAALFPEAKGIESLPLPEFLAAARGLANAQHEPDPGGVYRRVRPLTRFRGHYYPSLGIALAHAALDPAGPIRVTREREIVIGGRRLALERDGSILLRFTPEVRAAHEAAVEAWDALEASDADPPVTASPADFAGKIAIIGYSAPGLYDLRPNPLMSNGPGMLVHAATVMNILEGRSLRTWTREARWPLFAALAALAALTGALVAATAFVRRQVAALVGVGFAWFFFAAWWAFPRDLVVDLIAPECAVTLAFAGGTLLNYATEGRQRRIVKEAFQHYLSPAFVEELLRDPSKLRLGGERRELTIFFSDLAGFTTMSEKLEPEELVRLLNLYLTRMTTIILKLGGTHDKYEGDAIMAFFGAPVEVPRHASFCCLAAIEQQEAIAELNAEWRALGLPEVHARMGINTGNVVVGNMGSEQTMDYTVMGDSVNLASRLEGANKPFGTRIMVGERTRELAQGDVEFRELAGLRVKGKKKPVTVFEVLGAKGAVPEAQIATARRFEAGLRLYEARDFAGAARVFAELKAAGDPPSSLYLEECERFIREPPGADWVGVIVLTAK